MPVNLSFEKLCFTFHSLKYLCQSKRTFFLQDLQVVTLCCFSPTNHFQAITFLTQEFICFALFGSLLHFLPHFSPYQVSAAKRTSHLSSPVCLPEEHKHRAGVEQLISSTLLYSWECFYLTCFQIKFCFPLTQFCLLFISLKCIFMSTNFTILLFYLIFYFWPTSESFNPTSCFLMLLQRRFKPHLHHKLKATLGKM